MAKLYKVGANYEYASLVVDLPDEADWDLRMFGERRDFQGQSVLDHWEAPPLFWDYPSKPKGAFAGVGYGTIAVASTQLEALGDLFKSCELLPVSVQGDEWFFINPLRVIDCVDRDRSTYQHWMQGQDSGITEIAYKLSRRPDEWFFRLPVHQFKIFTAGANRPSKSDLRAVLLARGVDALTFRDPMSEKDRDWISQLPDE